ncbi:MAG: GNAT family N-acetyltransferase [Pseudomonadota bacterium]
MAISVRSFVPGDQPTFEQLNMRWLLAYFSVEPVDRQVLGNPQKHLLDTGGHILMATLDDAPVGTCALKVHEPDELELTKMAVDPIAQGRGVGAALMQASIDYFQSCGRRLLWLETNHILTPAIRLYERFGFVRQGEGGRPQSLYQRSDYYMEWQGPPDPA